MDKAQAQLVAMQFLLQCNSLYAQFDATMSDEIFKGDEHTKIDEAFDVCLDNCRVLIAKLLEP